MSQTHHEETKVTVGNFSKNKSVHNYQSMFSPTSSNSNELGANSNFLNKLAVNNFGSPPSQPPSKAKNQQVQQMHPPTLTSVVTGPNKLINKRQMLETKNVSQPTAPPGQISPMGGNKNAPGQVQFQKRILRMDKEVDSGRAKTDKLSLGITDNFMLQDASSNQHFSHKA